MIDIQMRIKGQIDASWSECLRGMSILHTELGETVVVGRVRDESELRGVLDRVLDLGWPLVSVASTQDFAAAGRVEDMKVVR